ncbi:MAG: hypothetical protein JO261_02540 [Alphaproteobacteria bacterium]|nr:hypothetical protein [Alphaproteobacteria bacterium]MBV9692556.1 hypothetical protein [Alphaproteobacteria bacterium]
MRWTMLLACAALAGSSVSAFAQQASYDERILSDPLYLPLQGQIFGATNYAWGSTSQKSFDNTGTEIARSQITSNAVNQAVMYGLSDDLALNLDWGYDWRSNSRHDLSGGDIIRSSSGWTDPAFGLTWRAIDEAHGNAFDLDLRAEYLPDLFPAKIATTDEEGTIARGGRAADFGATFGRVTPNFTLAGTFDAVWLDTRQALNQNSGLYTTTSAVWNYRLGIESQFRFGAPYSINAGFGHSFNNDTTVFNGTTGLFHAATGGDVTDVHASLNYAFTPSMVASLNYQHNFYDSARDLFADPANDTSVRDKNEDLAGVTLRYVLQ